MKRRSRFSEVTKVAIVTDSSACLPQELVQRYGICIVPLVFTVGGMVYRDGVDITPSEFYKLLMELRKPPTTSAPSPGAYLEAYRELSQQGDSIFCVTITAKVSMAFDSARKARELAEAELPQTAIEVLDSLSAAGGQGFVVLAAAKAAVEGADLAQVGEEAKRMRDRVNLIVMFDTLYYVARGGRLPKVAGMVTAWAASALDIKLIVDVHGDVRLLDRVRTKRRALERLLSVMRERSGGKPLHINLHHAAAPEEAERLKEEILSQFDCAELLVTEFPPALGVHAGPGALALSFYAEE